MTDLLIAWFIALLIDQNTIYILSGFHSSDGKGFSSNTCSTQEPRSKDIWSCCELFSWCTSTL